MVVVFHLQKKTFKLEEPNHQNKISISIKNNVSELIFSNLNTINNAGKNVSIESSYSQVLKNNFRFNNNDQYQQKQITKSVPFLTS